jgi:rhodanese-related sulfurtransferase
MKPRTLCWLVIVALCGACRSVPPSPETFPHLAPGVIHQLLRDSPDTLVVDLRTPQEFEGEGGHLAKARNIPLERLPFRLLEISSFRNETFIVYCRDDECGDQGAKLLLEAGFEDGLLIDGGIEAWVKQGFRTARVVR